MKMDQRLKDYSTLTQEVTFRKYCLLFSENVFPNVDTVVTWLGKQLKEKVESPQTSEIFTFEEAIHNSQLISIIRDGDDFYSSIFDSSSLIRPESYDLVKPNPFFEAIKSMYNNIWCIKQSAELKSLIIYSELQRFVGRLLGKHIANDPALSNYSSWIKISQIVDSEVYKSWTNCINKDSLRKNVDSLLFIPSTKQLHELADILNFGADKFKASLAYSEKLTRLKNKTDWDFVSQATDNSDMLSLREDLYLQECLLLSLGTDYWVFWLDNLPLPILQDHAFYSIQNLSTIQEVIEIVIKNENKLKTKPEHLLLIALKHYHKLVHKITNNLFSLQEGKWYLEDPEIKNKIVDEAKKYYENWITKELFDSCHNIFQIIFPSIPLSESRYFLGVFNWITSYSSESYFNNINYHLIQTVGSTINNEFDKLLLNDKNCRNLILENTFVEKVNWLVFEKLIGLLQMDNTDSTYRDLIVEKYLQFLRSEYFNWNQGLYYNDEVISQAINFSKLLSTSLSPFVEWQRIYDEFVVLHEGWKTDHLNYRVKLREAFILIAGGGISYLNFIKENFEEGETQLHKILTILLSQYRNSPTLNPKEYEIVIKFLAHLKTKYCSSTINEFIELLRDRTDDLEFFISAIGEIVMNYGQSKLKLSENSITIIKDEIYNDYWKIEARYNNISQRNILENFNNLKKQILEQLNIH